MSALPLARGLGAPATSDQSVATRRGHQPMFRLAEEFAFLAVLLERVQPASHRLGLGHASAGEPRHDGPEDGNRGASARPTA